MGKCEFAWPQTLRASRPAQGAQSESGLVETAVMHHYMEVSTTANTVIPLMSTMKRFGPRLGIALLMATSASCLSLDTANEGIGLLTGPSGNDQTVEVGKKAAEPLVVRAFDSFISPMEGVEVTWSVTPSSGGSLSATKTVTDASGFTEVNFTAGATPGPVTVRATAEGLAVSFTITVVAASPG